MATNAKWLIVTLPALALLLATASSARAAAPPSQPGAIGRTPPRLSYTNGEVSFWRPGAQDWTTGQVNTPLAPGDELYTATQGDLELEAGTRAFVRAWGDTRLGLANQEPDFLQFTIPSGHLSVDLRGLDPGHSVELDTPNAAFTIEQPGYYRVDVTPERTSFITRRGGRATMRPATGQAVAIVPSEEVVLEGETVQSYVAPELDVWDQWNYARTDHLLESVSARYVPPDVYGVDDLDHYGTWRVVQTYGPVWVPEAVTPGWVPYSTGRWISDPHYGWTWVDTAPWGWAPYHYGRWVVVDGFWAWAPGPVVARPVYCPALVAFFGAPGIVVSAGAPVVSWVALSWGEPVVPWWGPAGFVGRPRWAGWGGPRVVNNVVINRTTVVNVNNITVYKNVAVQNSVVAVRQDHFGARPVEEARIAQVDVHRLQPVHGPLRVAPEAASFVAASGRAARPPETMRARPVVATRPLAGRVGATRNEVRRESPTVSIPAPRLVPTARTAQPATETARPPFGTGPAERQRPALPPRFGTPRAEAAPAGPRELAPSTRPAPSVEHRGTVGESAPQAPSPGRPAAAPTPERAQAARQLPGEPANRLFPGRAEAERGRPQTRPVGGHPEPTPGPSRERDQR